MRVAGKLVPHVGMYSKRPISEGEELTFMYGVPNAGAASKSMDGQLKSHKFPDEEYKKVAKLQGPRQRECLCGSSACLGFLPCDSTL